MIYIKINETLYPAEINGLMNDRDWDNRESKTIILEMDYATAVKLFVDGLSWNIVMDVYNTIEQAQEDGSIVTTQEQTQEEYDNSEFCVAGSITDNRDGTLSVKMGKMTEIEKMQVQLANAVTEEELYNAYTEGVNSI